MPATRFLTRVVHVLHFAVKLTHWQSPHMHAYFPALNSPASLLGDMLADGLNCLGFTWASSPAVTELEVIVMDWLAKMLGLPQCFLHSNETGGGGVIQVLPKFMFKTCSIGFRKQS